MFAIRGGEINSFLLTMRHRSVVITRDCLSVINIFMGTIVNDKFVVGNLWIYYVDNLRKQNYFWRKLGGEHQLYAYKSA